ncbi:MAG: hypothetical protein M0R18_11545 [Deltaproteobacteria bacterium]|jgi:hypothetical protein|nr:hypothetical protein [Deltaproteobacteria bacterium]MCK9502426.1 hypothetical protein [Lascolabacillus sp.]
MSDTLFPEVERYIEEVGMLNKLKGHQAQLYRILGQGRTRSKELDLPPAVIERKMELVAFKPLQEPEIPTPVKSEIEEVRKNLESELARLKKAEEQKKLANQVLRQLQGINCGIKDNRFFAGRLILSSEKGGKEWTWSLTPYYPIIANIPPDPAYIANAFVSAEKVLQDIILPPEIFETKLHLAWQLARHFTIGEKVLIIDVARMYKVAGQPDRFWNAPKKGTFVDMVDAAFIANLINWLKHPGGKAFSFAQATLHQAHGRNAKAFYLPVNVEGTQTRPVIFMEKK